MRRWHMRRLHAVVATCLACGALLGCGDGASPSDGRNADTTIAADGATDSLVRDASPLDAPADSTPGLDVEPRADASDATTDVSADHAAPADAGCPPGACGIQLVSQLSSPFIRPTLLVVAASDVYFSYLQKGWVGRVSKGGGAAQQVYSGGATDDVVHFAVDAAQLFLLFDGTSNYRLDRVALPAGSATALFTSGFASNADRDNFVIDATDVYLASGSGAGGAATVKRIDRTSGQLTTLYSQGAIGRYLAANSSDLFWLASGSIYRAPKSGATAPVQLASPGTTVRAQIAVDGGDVFYTYRSSVDLVRVSGTPPTTTSLTPTPVNVDSVAGPPVVDATYVYVMAYSAGDVATIYRVQRSGGSVTVFAPAQPSGRALTQDSTHIYWAVMTPNGGAIVRKAK